ncbi:coagulation factor XIII A chain-like [Micropterus dolomieu]|uniref:coagulation factor XIII A chain-like n=1 Tax=Micropterus dolomieu TaxID=147949 RepID=UPI001E8ED05D|nr:coagulation factor XIII A chain-like [Micropterus dolomieu]
MSAVVSQPSSYTGRFNRLPATNNLHHHHDLPEFEPFDEDAKPRAPAPAGASLSVNKVDMCQQMNKAYHYTTAYNTPKLAVRRGQEFVIQVTFSRPLTANDDFQLEFLIGSDPSAIKGSLQVVTFGSRSGGPWSGRIVENKGSLLMLGVTPTPNAIVGRFRTYVTIVTDSGLQRTRTDENTDLYLLFNAWCPEDAVFLGNDAERNEYVLNDNGVIFQGIAEAPTSRNWMYGQFERGVLDACIYILDVSRMPIENRGNVIELVRKGSAMINAQDDNGVVVGNWSDNYSMGTAPTSWTGSAKILLQYANTGVSVCFGQCWVFAGVFNTFLRCLGIPARTITTFNSAHDNTGNLKTDIIYNTDGTPDTRNTRDSIWNYHCWNEVFITRPDLPPGLGGWQAVDATPQETSDGYYRCGPASIAAIRDGLLCHPFDSGFVFAEVNSDVVFYKRDRYGTLTPFNVDKTRVGKIICTKALGSTDIVDITRTYKYSEGSAEDNRTMTRAEEYGLERDHTQLPKAKISIVITADDVALGQDVILAVDFLNQGSQPQTVQAHLAGYIVFYTGIKSVQFKAQDFTVTVPANQTNRVNLKITAQEYLPELGSQLTLKFVVTGQSDDQSVNTVKMINLQTPTLNITVSGQPRVRQQMFVNVSFTNPFAFSLKKVNLAMEGAGLMDQKTRFYSVIDPQSTISWNETFYPRLEGNRRLMAVMDCSNLHQVWNTVDILVMP